MGYTVTIVTLGKGPHPNRKAGLFTRPLQHFTQRELNLRGQHTLGVETCQSPVLGTWSVGIISMTNPFNSVAGNYGKISYPAENILSPALFVSFGNMESRKLSCSSKYLVEFVRLILSSAFAFSRSAAISTRFEKLVAMADVIFHRCASNILCWFSILSISLSIAPGLGPTRTITVLSSRMEVVEFIRSSSFAAMPPWFNASRRATQASVETSGPECQIRHQSSFFDEEMPTVTPSGTAFSVRIPETFHPARPRISPIWLAVRKQSPQTAVMIKAFVPANAFNFVAGRVISIVRGLICSSSAKLLDRISSSFISKTRLLAIIDATFTSLEDARSFASAPSLLAFPASSLASDALSLRSAISFREEAADINSPETPKATSITKNRSNKCSFVSDSFRPLIFNRTAIGLKNASVLASIFQNAPELFANGSTCLVSLLRRIHNSPKHPIATANVKNISNQPKTPNLKNDLNILKMCMGISAILIIITAGVGLLVVLAEYKASKGK
jgi:hypothetical protein